MTSQNDATNPVVVFFDLGRTLVITPAKWIPGAAELLVKLRERGVRLGIISNTGDLDRAALAAELPPDFDFASFDAQLVLLSSEVGIEKPLPGIFQLAVQRAGGATAVFCTEQPEHALAAQRAGLLAHRVTAPPDSDIASVIEVLELAGILGRSEASAS